MMQKGRNDNHPRKGDSTKVSPIRLRKAIQSIKHSLRHQPRNHCLFTLGINSAYRAGELISLNVGQVCYLSVGDILDLKQSKNSEYRATALNSAAHSSLKNWLNHHPLQHDPGAPLFLSQRRQQGAICVETVNRLIKAWCLQAGLNGNYGSHTLRKTWGFQQRVVNKAPLCLLMRAFGHSSEAQTLEYLGILPDEIANLYLTLDL